MRIFDINIAVCLGAVEILISGRLGGLQECVAFLAGLVNNATGSVTFNTAAGNGALDMVGSTLVNYGLFQSLGTVASGGSQVSGGTLVGGLVKKLMISFVLTLIFSS
jgi:hypothetical protein